LPAAPSSCAPASVARVRLARSGDRGAHRLPQVRGLIRTCLRHRYAVPDGRGLSLRVSFRRGRRLIDQMDPISEPEGREALLVRQAQAGDPAAFDRLAGHYRGSLLAHAFLRTGDMEAAEDLVQEVLTRAWQKLRDL